LANDPIPNFFWLRRNFQHVEVENSSQDDISPQVQLIFFNVDFVQIQSLLHHFSLVALGISGRIPVQIGVIILVQDLVLLTLQLFLLLFELLLPFRQ